MTICISTNYLDDRSIYPVLDPRRTAGPGPYAYAYTLGWDAIQINVQRNPTLSNCTMIVGFTSTLTEFKEIQAYNIFTNNVIDRIGSSGLGFSNTMTITRAGSPGQSCAAGTETVVLCRHFAWPRGRTALYTFEPQDFWDFWGGCTVTFDWVRDNISQGNWGNQTPLPVYPLVRLPDRTLMTDGASFRVVFGGTDFAVTDPAYLTAMNFDTNSAIPLVTLPPFPADGTLLRDSDRPEVFIVYGGAKFWIPKPPRLSFPTDGTLLRDSDRPEVFVVYGGDKFRIPNPPLFAFDWSQVKVVPPGGTSKLGAMPINGTLIKEQSDFKVFYSDGNALRWVTSPTVMDNRCFAWRHVRIVPDNALAPLPRGPDLT